jgi:putative transposase
MGALYPQVETRGSTDKTPPGLERGATAMSYWRLFYHVVWGTKRRESLIDETRADVIERSIRASCHDLDVIAHAIGFMPDHVHLVISVPPRHALAAVVKHLKGESTHLLNHSAGGDGTNWFAWQTEYGIMSFSERSLDDVVAYAMDQRARHANDDLWPSYEIVERQLTASTSETRRDFVG